MPTIAADSTQAQNNDTNSYCLTICESKRRRSIVNMGNDFERQGPLLHRRHRLASNGNIWISCGAHTASEVRRLQYTSNREIGSITLPRTATTRPYESASEERSGSCRPTNIAFHSNWTAAAAPQKSCRPVEMPQMSTPAYSAAQRLLASGREL